MSHDELLERFESATLTGEEFTHREHVRLGWVYVTRYPLLEVLERFPRYLRRLAAALGAHGLYHETITWFFLLLVHDRIARGDASASWDDFAASNPDLLTRSSEIMNRHYRETTWQSPLARERFLLPDRNLAPASSPSDAQKAS